MAENKEALLCRGVVVNFLRGELESRYSRENLARFGEFESLPEEVLTAFRTFVLDRIYPEPENRMQLNRAFETLEALLHSPTRIQPLVRATMGSFWRLGRKIPAAIQAGRRTMQAFGHMCEVEEIMVGAALANGLPSRGAKVQDELAGLFNELPPEPFEQLVNGLVALLRSLSDRAMLDAALEIARKLERLILNSPKKWTEAEKAGVTLARETLEEGLALFTLLDPEQTETLIEGVERVEWDWIETLREAYS